MAIRRLLNLARRRSHSSAVTTAASTAPPPPSPPSSSPTTMIYDRAADTVKSKLKRLEMPDSRFLSHTSPHPICADHTSILSSPETRVTTLPNGLRVATESRLPGRAAAVGVWIDSGSRFESDADNGVAHFLERMVFKGTENRPDGVLMEEIGSMGGHVSARTSREHTVYCAEVMDENVPKALDVLSDMLQNSCFREDQMERERDLILQQIKEAERPSKEIILDHLHATAFQYTPLGRTVVGPVKNIKTIHKSHIKDYISAHYAAHRMVISASGAIKHEDIVKQVKKTFTKLSANPSTACQLVAEKPAVFTGSEVRIIDDDLPLAQFAVAFEGASSTDPDSIALMVIKLMLGSWNKKAGGGKHMGSQLVQRVAINEIAECITAFSTNYKDTGLFGVYAVAKVPFLYLSYDTYLLIAFRASRTVQKVKIGFPGTVDPKIDLDCLDDLAYAIMLEISRLPYRVSEEDVARACNQLKSSLLLHINGLSPVVEDIGHQLLNYGRRIPLAELFARIDAVDSNTVKRVANRFIFDRDIAIAAMGPIQGLPDYNWFRRRTYLLRY